MNFVRLLGALRDAWQVLFLSPRLLPCRARPPVARERPRRGR